MDELLRKYRAGELSPEETMQLRKELAKFKALYDFTLEEEWSEDSLIPESGGELSEETETKNLKGRIRRRWLKTALVIGTAVLALTGAGLWVIPKIIDQQYYDPTAGLSEKRQSDYQVYQQIRSQVDTSQNTLVNAAALKKGTAAYQMSNTYFDEFSGQYYQKSYDYIYGKIDNSKYDLENTSFGGGYLSVGVSVKDREPSEEDTMKADYEAKLAQLPDSSWLKLKLKPQDAVSLQSLQELVAKQPELQLLSGIVWSKNKNNQRWGLKFSGKDGMDFSIKNMAEGMGAEFQHKYPMALGQAKLSPETSEEELITYYTSNIQYLLDHQQDDLLHQLSAKYSFELMSEYASKTSEEFTFKSAEDFYHTSFFPETELKDQLAFLKEQGLKFDGLTVSIPKNKLQDFLKDAPAGNYTVEDVTLINLK